MKQTFSSIEKNWEEMGWFVLHNFSIFYYFKLKPASASQEGRKGNQMNQILKICCKNSPKIMNWWKILLFPYLKVLLHFQVPSTVNESPSLKFRVHKVLLKIFECASLNTTFTFNIFWYFIESDDRFLWCFVTLRLDINGLVTHLLISICFWCRLVINISIHHFSVWQK